MKKVMAIIPARAGSKGVKAKNIKPLHGKPLIAYTIEEAKKSKLIDKLIVSTDSVEISDIALQYGAEVPFLRPKELATDTSLTYDVVEHALNYLQSQHEHYDIIVLLQPTTPFRKVKSIDDAIETLLTGTKYTSVVSVVDVEGTHPLRMKKIEEGFLKNYIEQASENMMPRHELPKVYIRSGAIYAIATDAFFKNRSLVSQLCAPMILDKIETINIDTMLDFKLCEYILSADHEHAI